jgi:trk system potassium uptake protein TrkH
VILFLIQIGGLGIMTMAAFVTVAIGRRLGITEKTRLRDVLDTGIVDRVRSTVVFIVAFTFLFEVAGAAVLYLRWKGDPAVPSPLFAAVFHAISAFCNAGFSTFHDSLVRFRSDPVVNGTVLLLIVAGGLGFAVLWNLVQAAPGLLRRHRKPWFTLHTKFVFLATGALIVIGFAGFLAFEWNGALAGTGAGERLWISLFQSLTPRTAGFNTVEIGELRSSTLFLLMGLMFCGGAPGSTAGGVKVTTVMILGAAALALVRGRQEGEVVAFRRNIPIDNIRRALAIFFLFALTTSVFTLLLLVTENQAFEGVLFETFSAVGTVGLSTGLTPELTTAGKILVTLLMFIGRIGPITIAVAVTGEIRKPVVSIQYPEARVMVG